MGLDLTVRVQFGMIRPDLIGSWATSSVVGATFDSVGSIWDDNSGLEMWVGYVESRWCYI